MRSIVFVIDRETYGSWLRQKHLDWCVGVVLKGYYVCGDLARLVEYIANEQTIFQVIGRTYRELQVRDVVGTQYVLLTDRRAETRVALADPPVGDIDSSAISTGQIQVI